VANPVALQMYTVRDESAKDFVQTFKRVAGIGYRAVELAGTGGFSAKDLKALLTDLNFAVAGSHVSLQQLENDLDSALDYNQELGNKNVVCPWLPEERRKSGDDYRALADTLNRAGAACVSSGMRLCYHNHAFEFETFDGQTGWDILFQATDPNLVKAEMDVYWVEYGGQSAVEYLRKYAGRVPLVHLKDMADDEKRSFAELGQGTLDFDAILAAGDAAGVEWYIVEQDVCQRPSLESAQISLEYLQGKGRG
jgi:sugar phosphate isomerase/epimerase